MPKATETIRVTPEQADRLHDLKGRTEAYHEVVQRLLDAYDADQNAEEVED